MKVNGKIKDQDGNTWQIINKNPYYYEGMRMHGMYKVCFRRNPEDVLFKTGIFGEGECEDMIAGKGRIRLNAGRVRA